MTNATDFFKNVFFISNINWIGTQTSHFDCRFPKGASPSMKSVKFCHRFQQWHNCTFRVLFFIFLNAPFTLAVLNFWNGLITAVSMAKMAAPETCSPGSKGSQWVVPIWGKPSLVFTKASTSVFWSLLEKVPQIGALSDYKAREGQGEALVSHTLKTFHGAAVFESLFLKPFH